MKIKEIILYGLVNEAQLAASKACDADNLCDAFELAGKANQYLDLIHRVVLTYKDLDEANNMIENHDWSDEDDE